MANLTVFVKLKCKPGKRDDVLRLVEEKCKPYMDVNTGYDLYFISWGT